MASQGIDRLLTDGTDWARSFGEWYHTYGRTHVQVICEIVPRGNSLAATWATSMKRLTPRFRNWLRHRQAARQRAFMRARRPPLLVTVSMPSETWLAVRSRGRPLPATLCFDQAPEETIAALAKIRFALNVGIRGSRQEPSSKRKRGKLRQVGTNIDFEPLQSITPAAALVLAAEYERKKLRGNRPSFVANVEAWNPHVLAGLREIGFFEIVGHPATTTTTDLAAPQVILKMRSGDSTDASAITQLIDDLRQLYPDAANDSGLLHLYGAMLEAIANVVSHAYPPHGTYRYKPVRRWWMTGAVDREARWTTAVVFDQGITIPVSLPTWHRFAGVQQRVRAAMSTLLPGNLAASVGLALPSDPRLDAQAIVAAVEESVSSTGEAHRGHGLAQMREFVDQCRDGRLRVISRQGQVVYRSRAAPETRVFNASLGGTLIEWSVIL